MYICDKNQFDMLQNCIHPQHLHLRLTWKSRPYWKIFVHYKVFCFFFWMLIISAEHVNSLLSLEFIPLSIHEMLYQSLFNWSTVITTTSHRFFYTRTQPDHCIYRNVIIEVDWTSLFKIPHFEYSQKIHVAVRFKHKLF